MPNTHHHGFAGKAVLEAQYAALTALATVAVHALEKITALNVAVAKASSENIVTAARNLLVSKEPQSFFTLTTAYGKPDADKAAAYYRDLNDILTATKDEFIEVAGAQLTEVRNRANAWVSSNVKDASLGSGNVFTAFKDVVADYQGQSARAVSAAKAPAAATAAAPNLLTHDVEDVA